MKLSEHFSLEEMSRSDYAVRNGINNEPSEAVIENMRQLCVNVLEPLREIVKKPIHINSGYRSPEVNTGIGGSKTSQHCEGKAADITVHGMTIDELFDIASKSMQYDQVIHEFGRWVHISFNGSTNRKQMLWAVKQDGVTKYLHQKP